MAQVVRIGAPRDFEVRENVPVVDGKDRFGGLLNVLRPCRGEVTVVLPIIICKGYG